jgi:hypothetical protein
MAVNKVVMNTENGAQTLIDLTNDTIIPEAIAKGLTAHDASGTKITGTFTLDDEMSEQDSLIARIKTALQGKAAGGGSNVPSEEPNIQPLEIKENGTYTAPDGVDGYSPITVNVASGGSDLPAGYSRVDYILFTGRQIVDTGIICNKNTKIQTYFTRASSTQEYLYGVASSNNTASVTAYLGGSWRFGNKAATKTVGTVNAKVGYAAYVDVSTISVSNHVAAISGVNDFETVGSLLIGSCRSASGAVGAAQFDGTISFFSMWEGDEQVLKLVPVTDGTIFRFWDMVSKTFFDSITDTPLDGGNL